MEDEILLPSSGGSWWEDQVFGVSCNGELLELPPHLNFHESMQEVMWTPLERLGQDGQLETYDPMNPNWGKSGQLWFEVRRHLPLRVGGMPSGPLFLHIACRTKRTSLDFYHGVDAFFFWEGVFVTIDVSLLEKAEPKADFLVTPREMEPERLGSFGNEIAQLLKEGRRKKQKTTRKKVL